jgi:hypothetical protein
MDALILSTQIIFWHLSVSTRMLFSSLTLTVYWIFVNKKVILNFIKLWSPLLLVWRHTHYELSASFFYIFFFLKARAGLWVHFAVCLCYHLYMWKVADFHDIWYEYCATGDHSPLHKFYVFSHPCRASIKVSVRSTPPICRPRHIKTWNLCNGPHEIL